MEARSLDPTKELRLLLAFFGETALPAAVGVAAADVPEPSHRLLVHNQHMTVTLEDYFGGPLVVRPYLVHRQGSIYGRKLDLISGSGIVVMTGIMLFNFQFCSDHVRDEIIDGQKPLGRILIENNFLRRISATAFIRIPAEDPLVARFDLPAPLPAFGRLATIYCNEKPAVDLLEVVRPESPIQ